MRMVVSPQKGDDREVRGWDGILMHQVSLQNMLEWLILSLGLRFVKQRFDLRKLIRKMQFFVPFLNQGVRGGDFSVPG